MMSMEKVLTIMQTCNQLVKLFTIQKNEQTKQSSHTNHIGITLKLITHSRTLTRVKQTTYKYEGYYTMPMLTQRLKKHLIATVT